MTLGMFAFTFASAPLQDRAEKKEWRFAEGDRVGARPAVQFLGPGDDTVTLTGMILPGFAGAFTSIETLERMAGEGQAWPLLEGDGRVLGNFRIDGIDVKKGRFLDTGEARRGEFSIDLKRVS